MIQETTKNIDFFIFSVFGEYLSIVIFFNDYTAFPPTPPPHLPPLCPTLHPPSSAYHRMQCASFLLESRSNHMYDGAKACLITSQGTTHQINGNSDFQMNWFSNFFNHCDLITTLIQIHAYMNTSWIMFVRRQVIGRSWWHNVITVNVCYCF